MRTEFREYYPPTDEELNRLTREGVVVLDTNALLQLYRYSKETSDSFLKLFRSLRARLWVPHQVALEFHRSRLQVVNDQFKKRTPGLEGLKISVENLKGAVQDAKKIDFSYAKSIEKLLGKASAELSRIVESYQTSIGDSGIPTLSCDPILNELTDILSGCVGPAYSDDELEKIYQEGKDRYSRDIPPGYKDKNKPEPSRYGDLVLWKQLLDKVREAPSAVIFITNDAKKDWWEQCNGQKIAPLPELLKEFHLVCNQPIHFYSTRRFMDLARKELGFEVASNSIAEIEQVSDDQKEENSQGRDATNALLWNRRAVLLERMAALFADTQNHSRHQDNTSDTKPRLAERLEEVRVAGSRLDEFDSGSFNDEFSYMRETHRNRAMANLELARMRLLQEAELHLSEAQGAEARARSAEFRSLAERFATFELDLKQSNSSADE